MATLCIAPPQDTSWGSSFYVTDGSNGQVMDAHQAGRPRNQLDGSLDNAMCNTVEGVSYGVCNRVSKDQFRKTVAQIADSKYSQNCNGHGICDSSVGFCICDL